MAANQKTYRSKPYDRELKDYTKSTVDTSDDTRINKIVSNFMLGNQPYTQLIIGLCDLDVDIRFPRNNAPFFELSMDELHELTVFNKRHVLSSITADGGELICVSQPTQKGGLLIERILEPFTCAMDFNDCKMQKFEHSHYESKQLEKHLPQARIAIERLIANKPVFECMYGIITTTMIDIHNRMKSSQDISDVYDELSRMLLYVPRSYFVREYLNHIENVKTPYQLFSVLESCLVQHAYLKKRLELNSFLNWGRV